MPGGHVGKVYQSVRGVVQGTLHRRKPDIMVSIRAKDDDGHLNDAMQELEKIFVDRIGGLKAALSDNQAVVASKAQHAEQVIEGLNANISALEAKLRETEDALHGKDVANQKKEESLSTEIRDLQSVVQQKEEVLESRDSEVNDLKSNRDVLAEQITRLELATQQAKGEAANKAQHAEQVIEGLKANITALEAKLRETEDALHRKDVANQKKEESLSTEIRDLQSVVQQKEEVLESRDSEVNDLKSNRDVLAEQITRLELATQQAKGEAANKAQHAEQVIGGLKANITALEAKLRETEDALHRKDVANQKVEESLSTEIRDLQSVVKQKEEALKSQDSEVNDLKSSRDVLAEQISRLELAIQQAKGEAASKVQHAEQVIDGLKANITALEAKLRETEDALHGKDVANHKMEESLSTEIRDLQSVVQQKEEALESRDSEVNDLKSNRDVLAEQITRLELAIQQAKGEAASKAQHAGQVIEGLKANITAVQAQLTQREQIVVGTDCTMTGLGKDRDTQAINLNAELKSPTNGIKKVAGAMSVVTEAARKTVSQDAFARMTAEFSKLTNIMGGIASLIVRHHVRGLGESMEEFPQTRLTELLDSLSGQITDDKLKADFRKRFGKV